MTRIYQVAQTQSETRRLTHLLLKLVIIIGVISVSEFVAIPAVAGQTLVGTMTLTRGDDNSFSALIDSAHGFAYFATDTAPGIVVKVRLSDFTRVGSLVLQPREQFLSAAVIDPTNGFAYFSTQFAPGTIYKIRLSDFTLVNSVSIAPALGPTPLIDITSGLSYWGTLGAPASILRIRLSDLTITGNLTLGLAE